MFRTLASAAVIALAASAAVAAEDARTTITRQIQEMNDAVSNGDAAVWERYLDRDSVYVAEDGSISGKADMVKQITPLPAGISGIIKAEVVRFAEDGDVATVVYRVHETENYFGQTLHAEYLSTNVWRRRADGWKLIAGQVLAENTDPPAIDVSAARLAEYAGTYRLKDSDVVYSVSVGQGALTAVRTGRPAVTLKAEAQDVFFVAGQPRVRKIFLRDTGGHITGFVDRREGRDVVWIRTR